MTLPFEYNWVDVVAAVVVAAGCLRGLRRGLSGELARLVGVVVAVWAGWRFYEPLGLRIYRATRLEEQPAQALAFLIVVAGGYLVMLVARLALRQVMEFTFKGRLERLGGALCGLVKSCAGVAAVLIFMSLVPHDYLREVFVERSLVGRTIHTYWPAVYADLAERYPQLPPRWPEGTAETNDASRLEDDVP